MSNIILIHEDNLSIAWAKAFQKVMVPGQTEVSPLIVTIDNLNNNYPVEIQDIREELDSYLIKMKSPRTCHQVANTIFPIGQWEPHRDRQLLYSKFLGILPYIRKYQGNRNGIYFERMIHFGKKNLQAPVNQLEHIISTRMDKGNKRRSSYIVSIFDPSEDHTNQPVRGFPCLQQVSFVPYDNDKLMLNAFYPNQHILDRAYGNYLGLCRLGLFIAHEFGLCFNKMVCYAGIAQLGNDGKYKKSELTPLKEKVDSILSEIIDN